MFKVLGFLYFTINTVFYNLHSILQLTQYFTINTVFYNYHSILELTQRKPQYVNKHR